jgi:hypothetical protein
MWVVGGNSNGTGVVYDPNTKFTLKVYRRGLPKWPQQQPSAHWRYTDREASNTFQRKSLTRVTLNGVAEDPRSDLGLVCTAVTHNCKLVTFGRRHDLVPVRRRSATVTSAAQIDIWGSQSGVAEDSCLLGCARKNLGMFTLEDEGSTIVRNFGNH